MKRRRTRNLFKIIGFLNILNGAYWLFYWELIFWRKDLAAALTANLFSTFTLFFGIFLVLKADLIVNRLPRFLVEPLESWHSEAKSPKGVKVHKSWIEAKLRREGGKIEEKGYDLLASMPDQGPVRLSLRKKGKIRVPGLLFLKRVLAALFMIFYFLIAQISMTGGGMNILVGVVFLLTSFLMLDYLWKTRLKAEWRRDRMKKLKEAKELMDGSERETG